MYDTIEIISPPLSPDIVNVLRLVMQKKCAYDLDTGEELYSLITGQLAGSYDSRIALRFLGSPGGTCLKVSCSPHKLILGHNVFGGPVDIKNTIRYLVNYVGSLFNICLPVYTGWLVARVDVAHVYDLDNLQNVKNYIASLRGAFYARRPGWSQHGLTGLYYPGRTTTLKFYSKGPEFKKHDAPRLAKCDKDGNLDIQELQLIADRLLRIEVEVRARKLRNDGKSLIVGDLEDSYFLGVYMSEVLKVVDARLDSVKTFEQVRERLFDSYPKRTANRLLALWSRLSVEGESRVRETMSSATFRRNVAELREVGVSWKGTDVGLQNNVIDFVPLLESRRHLDFIHPLVLNLCG